MFKLVIHISDLEKWPTAINNVRNTAQSLSITNTPFEIIIIANAGAVKGYLAQDIRTQIAEITTPHIQFFACNNSLTGQNIALTDLNAENMPSTINIVPVAIIALVTHQNAGFAYIKP